LACSSFATLRSGLKCLSRWREQCLEWCFDRLEPHRFGDQKYLDEWPSRYPGGVVVLEHKGAALGPNNLGNYRFWYEQGTTFVDEDPLVFYNFTRLRVITPWLYEPGVWAHGQSRLNPILKHHVYVPYARELRAARTLVQASGGKIPSVDSLRWTSNRLLLLARMARHRSFLLTTDALAL
jgi:hypothetical protein